MLIFAYGTLRKGAPSAADERFGAKFVASDKIRGSIYDVSWYPGYKSDDQSSIVYGDVFHVTPEELEAIDRYEGVPFLYSRKRVMTESGLEVFTYEYNDELLERHRIVSGDWMEYVNKKEYV